MQEDNISAFPSSMWHPKVWEENVFPLQACCSMQMFCDFETGKDQCLPLCLKGELVPCVAVKALHCPMQASQALHCRMQRASGMCVVGVHAVGRTVCR